VPHDAASSGNLRVFLAEFVHFSAINLRHAISANRLSSGKTATIPRALPALRTASVEA
jgi:hypothetical protein